MGVELSAGDALAAAGIDVDAVRHALPRVAPDAVPIRRAGWLFRLFWAKGISAVATPWGIYVLPAVFDRLGDASEPERSGPLVVHELTHIEQFRRLGAWRHVTQYIGDYLRGRWQRLGHWESYRRVRLEVEARDVASRFKPGQVPR